MRSSDGQGGSAAGDDALAREVENYLAAGVTEVVLIVAGDDPVGAAERVAGLLPRLRSIG